MNRPGKGGHGQKDNQSSEVKVRMRRRLVQRMRLSSADRILEGFAGEGEMWRRVWCDFRGATIDRDEDKARLAAERRRGWAVYCGDTIRALRAGWMGHEAFRVVDLDAYGSPWPVLRAWFQGERTRAPETAILLTDGYGIHAAISSPCGVLFPERKQGERRDVSPAEYLAQVDQRIGTWAGEAGLEVTREDPLTDRHMLFHLLWVRDPGRAG